MAVNDESVEKLFDARANLHKNKNSVLDASPAKSSMHGNWLLDYFSKKAIAEKIDYRGKSVLDFGCGVGRLSALMGPKAGTLVGYDRSEKMCEVAIKNNTLSNVRFTNRFDDLLQEKFDVIFAYWVMAHIHDDTIVELFGQLKNALNPGGQIYFFEQTANGETNRRDDEVYNRRLVPEYEKIMARCGYRMLRAEPVFRFPSYARGLWTKFPSSFRFLLPLLYRVEKATVQRKPEFAEYYTTLMVFTPA